MSWKITLFSFWFGLSWSHWCGWVLKWYMKVIHAMKPSVVAFCSNFAIWPISQIYLYGQFCFLFIFFCLTFELSFFDFQGVYKGVVTISNQWCKPKWSRLRICKNGISHKWVLVWFFYFIFSFLFPPIWLIMRSLIRVLVQW